MPRVEELDTETQILLKASVAIPSLAVIIQELVYNSIDNEATCVAVRVNMDRNTKIQVVDNGKGVQNLPNLCEAAPTNKRKISRSQYGTKRGCFFYVTKLCEKVSITTRRHNSTQTKTFRSYESSDIRTEKRNRPSRGTTVTIENVFSQMPVRSISMSYMDLDIAKDALLRIAVANPGVSITLKDCQSGTKMFQTQSCPNYSDNFLIYCYNKLDWERIRQVRFEMDGYKLDCLLTTELYSKPRQLVFVNRRHVHDDRLASYTNELLLSALMSPSDKRNQENSYPVFVLFISCKPRLVDMCFESNDFLHFHNWETVHELVLRCITSFLEGEGLSLPQTQEEQSSVFDSPGPSLRSMLRIASPNINVRSDKVQRKSMRATATINDDQSSCPNDDNRCDIREKHIEIPCKIAKDHMINNVVDDETPLKPKTTPVPKQLVPVKRDLPQLNITPVKSNKMLRIEHRDAKHLDGGASNSSNFKTPPSKMDRKSLLRLECAPVLNHLVEAHERRDCKQQIKDLSCITGGLSWDTLPLSKTADNTGTTENAKRRASTPLCPSKTQGLFLAPISPIKTRPFLTPSVQTKRKRSQKSLASSKTKLSRYASSESADDSRKFHFKTPKYLLNSQHYKSDAFPGQKVCEDSTKHSRFSGKCSDSGYETTFKTSTVQTDSCILSSFEKTESSFFPSKTPSDSPKQFEIFHDNEDVGLGNNSKIVANSDSPIGFKSYWDDPSAGSSSESNTTPEQCDVQAEPFTIFEDIRPALQPKSAVIEIPLENTDTVVLDQKPKKRTLKMRDCASSPIKIPIDRGCSPVNFTQILYNDSTGLSDIESHTVSKLKRSQPNRAQDDFGNISDSILAGIDEQLHKSSRISETNNESELDDISLGELSLEESSVACFECKTQNVLKKLDFSSQVAAPQFKIHVSNKENVMPKYRDVKPVGAATHLTADFNPWTSDRPNITLKNKATSFDLRKWTTKVFETHGEGAWDARVDKTVGMKFILDGCQFDKSVFEGISVLGQIDSKFIGCVTARDLLVLVDQHAAHERVRLENMLDTLHHECDRTKAVVSHPLPYNIPIDTSRPERDFISNINSKLEFMGFKCELTKYSLDLVAVPRVCFTDSGEINIEHEKLSVCYLEGVEQVRSSSGSNLSIPNTLVEYLHSKACHGAIRFGDELSKDQCEALIEQLSVCDLPFQCAHGRPSFAPIVKLNKDGPGGLLRGKEQPACEQLNFLKLRERFH